MKLDHKRTVLVGLAFLSICAFWQMYDNIIPLILTNTFHLDETISGAIMAADNVLALFLLPFFGALSDRTGTRIGRRMPFILGGTACAVVLMNLLPLFDNGYAATGEKGKLVLFVVALGLLLILPAAIRLEAFEYLEKEQIALAYGVEGIVERQKQEYAPTYRRSMTQGVVLCVLAVVPILGTAMLGVPDFWVAAAVGLLLAIVAGAVQLFIRAGMTQGSFDKLLQTGEYTVREKWTNRRVGWFAGAYWCGVTAVYLDVSFRHDSWNTSWWIWAVAGVLFAAMWLAVRAWAGRSEE